MKRNNLLNRTAYTFFSSLLTVDDIINYSIENNLDYASIVDLNVMYGAFELYKKAKQNNLKPIIGLQVIYNDINKTFIAKNYDGYKELMKISSAIQAKEELKINNKDLIEIDRNIHITAYKNKEDRKALELFASIGGKQEQIENKTSFLDEVDYEDYISQIVEEVDLIIPEQLNKLPKYPTGEKSSNDFLESLLKKSLQEFIKENKIKEHQVYLDRLIYEFNVIKDMGYQDYFLIVWDIVKWAKENNIAVGPGRGSAAGSLISFLLNITTIDPIKNNLLFERFLNPERVSMPDIDIDFEDERREEVVNYIQTKYGEDRVAQIITFQTLRAKMSIKDVARAMEITATKANDITKLLSDKQTLVEAATKNKKFKTLLELDDEVKKVWESAKLIEGLPRQFSTHAAGVVLSDKAIVESVPTQPSYGNLKQTQYPMNDMEINGLLKIDILGLRNLSFIKKTLELIDDKNLDLDKIDFEDKKVYKLLSLGKTGGIFQLESPGMTGVLKKMRPDKFEDIVATTSLFRPGPQKMIPEYIKGKENPSKITYLDPSLEPILKETYGIIVYQEQIMEIAQAFAGLSLAKADILRRAIGKKDISLIDKLKDEFFNSALELGRDEKTIERIYELIYEFSEYGFNRSHAFAYTVISYQLAYLKVHYPLQFMVSLLSTVQGNVDKTSQYIEEAMTLGIKIERPDINKSKSDYTIEGKRIRYSLKAIKGVGPAAVNDILKERENGDFKSFADFMIRMSLYSIKKNTIEILIKAGAFDSLGNNRTTLLNNIETFANYANLITITKDGEKSLDRTLMPEPKVVDFEDEKSNKDYDYESLKFTFEENALNQNAELLEKLDVKRITDLEEGVDSRIAGELKFVRKLTTKTGSPMAFGTLEDQTDKVSLTFWPATFSKYENEIIQGKILILEGKIDNKRQTTFIVSRLKEMK